VPPEAVLPPITAALLPLEGQSYPEAENKR
jgi:hypothetical protein